MSLNSNSEKLQNLLEMVNELPEATTLDELSTPATAAQILSPYEALDADGKKMTGTITTKTASNLTASGATVTVPAGYYASQATKSVGTATQATPSITINASGLITATATQTAGYVTAGSKSATKQLAFQAAKTITPTAASQIAVSSGYYTGGSVTVAAIPSTYVQPSGTLNVTANGTHNVKNYASISVSVAGSGGDTSVEDGLVTRTLTSYENSRVTSIGSSALYNFSRLTSVNFPACTNINVGAFGSCTSLTSISFPACRTIGARAFEKCTKLTSVNFPVCTLISLSAFWSCTRLTSASFPKCIYMYSGVFEGCSLLSTIYLLASSVCTLSNSYAFYNTKIKSTSGSIYVPSSLVASYKAATNWTYFSNRIFSAP